MRVVVGVAVLAAMLIQTPAARSQASPELKVDDLYVVAMRAALEARARSYSSTSSKDNFNVFVEENSAITKRLPKQLEPFTLTVLDRDGMRKRFKEVGKFPLLRLWPMTNTGNQFEIEIGDYWFSYRRGIPFIRPARYIHEVEGGTELKLRYEPASDSFIVEQARRWGV